MEKIEKVFGEFVEEMADLMKTTLREVMDKLEEEDEVEVEENEDKTTNEEDVENEIQFEGETYCKVDRKPREGDVVIYIEATGNPFVSHYAYKVVKHDGELLAFVEGLCFDIYNVAFNRNPKNTIVYELVKQHKNPKVEVGDWIVLHEDFLGSHEYHGGKPYRVLELSVGFPIIADENGIKAYFEPDDYRLATDREITFTNAGRDVNEFKIGDIVSCDGIYGAVKEEYLGCLMVPRIEGAILGEITELAKEYFNLVCPVESRVDLDN